jgi:hypothetical protein
MDQHNNECETDTETQSTWDESTWDDVHGFESDSESIDELEFYEYDEISNTKYNLVLCEKYNKLIHGMVDGEINNHYLTQFRLKNINNDFINIIKTKYPAIRTEIAECIILNSDHCVSILKTFWLRLVQRVWKKIYKERNNVIKKRSNPKSIFHREIFGRWPDDCLRFPTMRGMLQNLSRTSF